jgi:hypothetical protein
MAQPNTGGKKRVNALFNQAAQPLFTSATARGSQTVYPKTAREGIVNVIRAQSAAAARQANNRKVARARQAAVKARPKNWRTYRPPNFDPKLVNPKKNTVINFDPKLVNTLAAIIKGAIPVRAAQKVITKLPPATVAHVVKNIPGNIPKNTAETAGQVISQGDQTNPNVISALNKIPNAVGPPPISAVRDPEAIGDVYYGNQRMGYAFPGLKFRLRKNKTQMIEYKGWRIRPRPGLEEFPRFEFYHTRKLPDFSGDLQTIILNSLKNKAVPVNVSASLTGIVTGAIPHRNVKNILATTAPQNISRKIANLVSNAIPMRGPRGPLFTGPPAKAPIIIENPGGNISLAEELVNNLPKEVQEQIKNAPIAQQNKIKLNLLKRFRNFFKFNGKGWTLPRLTPRQKAEVGEAVNTPPKRPSLYNRVFGSRTKQRPSNSVPGAPRPPSFFNRLFAGLSSAARKVMEATQKARNKPGNKSRLDALEKALKELLNKSSNPIIVKEFIHTYYPVKVMNGTAPPPDPSLVNRELRKLMPRNNFSSNNIHTLFKKRKTKNGPTNADLELRLRQEIRRLEGLSASNRSSEIGRLLKTVPMGFPGRSRLVELALKNIKNISRNENPSNAIRRLNNLRSRMRPSYTNRILLNSLTVALKRSKNNLKTNVGTGRRNRESIKNYIARLTNGKRRSYETQNNYNLRMRRAVRRPSDNDNSYLRRMEIFEKKRSETPENYNRRVAIESRREKLRENEINRRRRARGGLELPPTQNQAIENAGGPEKVANIIANVPGGIPAIARAAQSVNEIGPQNAVNHHNNHPIAVAAVKKLGGHTNTIHVLEGVRTMARRKQLGPRMKVLNAVLNEARKMNLAPVVARLVTKTGKIKNTSKTYNKKYTKTLIKSAILRKPAANRARQSARKKIASSPSQKGKKKK